jgi:hypothetical protein
MNTKRIAWDRRQATSGAVLNRFDSFQKKKIM